MGFKHHLFEEEKLHRGTERNKMRLWKYLFIVLFLTTYFQKVGILDQEIRRKMQEEVQDSLTEESKEGMKQEQEDVEEEPFTEEFKDVMKLDQEDVEEESFSEESEEARKLQQEDIVGESESMFQQNHNTSDPSATDLSE